MKTIAIIILAMVQPVFNLHFIKIILSDNKYKSTPEPS
jgi:hypothetical protein